jgi:hypothetical protein
LDTSWGDAERKGDLRSEDYGAGCGFGDVSEDAGTEAVFLIGSRVLVDRYLAGGAGVEELC